MKEALSLIEALKEFPNGKEILAKWDEARAKVDTIQATPPKRTWQPRTDFDARGLLAAKLTCWHRLTEEESDELVKLFIDHIPDATKMVRKQEHITDGNQCWCNPDTDYVDPDNGVAVIVHKEPQ